MSVAGGGSVGRRTVVFVHDTNEFGGLEVVLLRVLARLDRTRFTPIVVVPDTTDAHRASPPELLARLDELDVSVVKAPAPPGILGKIFEVVRLARILRRQRADVVHLHTSRVEGGRKAIVAAALARTPTVLRTEHNSPSAFSAMPADTVARRITDRWTDLVLTVSEHDRAEQLRLVGRRPERVRSLLNAVDHREFRPDLDADAARPLLRADTPVIGGVGRFTEQKGFEDLIVATATVIRRGTDVQLLLVGDGPLEAHLERRAGELGIDDHVVFAGRRADPKPFIASMDVAVMSSLHEGLPLSLLEFMAMGKPTVVTDHPGMLEAVVDGLTSIVVPRSSPDRLAAALETLVGDAELRQRMGEAARSHVVDHFTLDAYIAATEELYADPPRRGRSRPAT